LREDDLREDDSDGVSDEDAAASDADESEGVWAVAVVSGDVDGADEVAGPEDAQPASVRRRTARSRERNVVMSRWERKRRR